MSIGTYWIYGTIYDCDGTTPLNNVSVKLRNLVSDLTSNTFTTSSDGKYQINVGEIADEGDIIRIEITEPDDGSTIYRIVQIDLYDLATNEDVTFTCCPERNESMPTFSLIGTTYTVVLKMPEWDNVNNQLRRNLKHFAFWSGNYAVYDDDTASNPLILGGIDIGSNEYVVAFEVKYNHIHELMDNNEEITINTLESDTNGVYVIKDFRYTTQYAPCVFAWYIVLEFVRSL
jgi:hypothetical protein